LETFAKTGMMERALVQFLYHGFCIDYNMPKSVIS